MSILPFKSNKELTLGVELELQLVDLRHFDLAMEAKDFLRRILELPHQGEIKPEITQSMIEINSSIHLSYASLINELRGIKDFVTSQAKLAHIGICGGGAHPFQKWNEQRIYPTARFTHVSERYGFLAKQFTTFGQHIHIGCQDGDQALYLCHAFARYLPQFIALSASSPYHQGVDSDFDCARLSILSAFPLSGPIPWLISWKEFEEYYEKMMHFTVIKSLKDFYWDIRPKPEYGTLEIRICDTPLTIEKAADLATYAQLLAAYLLDHTVELTRDMYLTYSFNRFNAAKNGMSAIIVDPISNEKHELANDILKTCELISPYVTEDNAAALNRILSNTLTRTNDAGWLRDNYKKSKSLNDTVREQTDIWMSQE